MRGYEAGFARQLAVSFSRPSVESNHNPYLFEELLYSDGPGNPDQPLQFRMMTTWVAYGTEAGEGKKREVLVAQLVGQWSSLKGVGAWLKADWRKGEDIASDIELVVVAVSRLPGLH